MAPRSQLQLRLFLLAACTVQHATGLVGLTASYYGNTAGGAGDPVAVRVEAGVQVQSCAAVPLPAPLDFTATWTGVLRVTRDECFNFTVVADGTVRLWLDDHLLVDRVGHPAAAPAPAPAIMAMPLRAARGYPVRLEYTHYTAATCAVSLLWQGNFTAWGVVPATVFDSVLPAEQVARWALRRRMVESGWGTHFNQDMLTHVYQPDGFALSLRIVQVSTKATLTNVTVFRQNSPAEVRPGPHAYDSGFTEVEVNGWRGNSTILVQSARVEDDLVVAVTFGGALAGDLAVAVAPSFLWDRAGNITVDPQAGIIVGQGAGFATRRAFLAGTLLGSPPAESLVVSRRAGAGEPVTISTGQARNVSEVMVIISAARAAQVATFRRYGDLADVYEAVQTVMAWNTIYDPHEGVVTPVSRGWDFGAGYVLFDWDNLFLSYMAALDNRDLAYANAIQIVQARTLQGFVPNYASGTIKSRDRTEPPVGARIVRDIWRRYGDRWLLDLLFDSLYDWNTWFWEHRRLDPLQMICLGSDPNEPLSGDIEYNDLQAARYESGLDNSPMYDAPPCTFDNVTTHHMQLYDVGMHSMFSMEAEALAEVATVLGRDAEAAILAARHQTAVALMNAHMWDGASGVYRNVLANGTFAPSGLSPTSFYPMLAGAPADSQVVAMVKHLNSSDEFCVRELNTPANNTLPLVQMFSSARMDSALCESSACLIDQRSLYTYVRDEGVAMASPAGDGVVPLNLFYSQSNEDNLLVTNTSWNDTSYRFVRTEGYCLRDPQPRTVELDLWWSAERKDHVTCGTDACRGQPGYVRVGSLGCYAFAPECRFALPSIQRGVAAFLDQTYWRGRIWGPMVQLLYWGLERYAHVPEAAAARQALVGRSRELLLREWSEHHHVHENYGGDTGIGCDRSDSDPFYHWGALTGYIALLEQESLKCCC